MAVGRIFKISKEQANSYELLNAPKLRRNGRTRRARSNPGVTAIMGISNPARDYTVIPRSKLSPDKLQWVKKWERVFGGDLEVRQDKKTGELSATVPKPKMTPTLRKQRAESGRYLAAEAALRASNYRKSGPGLTAAQVKRMYAWAESGKGAPPSYVKPYWSEKSSPTRRAASKKVVSKPVRKPVKRALKKSVSKTPKLRAVKKTQTVGGIRCLAKPAAKYRRAGLTKRSQYALPQCFRYPVSKRTGKPDPKRIKTALTYYGKNKSRYSKAVQQQIERGIARAAKRAGLDSPKAMEYRRRYGLANPGDDKMIVMRKNAARKKPAAKRKTAKRKPARRVSPAKSFVLFPSRGKGRGVSAVAKANAKRKPAKKAARKSAKKMPKYNTKAYWKEMARRSALARKRKAGGRAAPKRKAAKRKPASYTRTPIRTRTGRLRVSKVKRAGRFNFLDVTGASRVTVTRGPTKGKRKSVRVAVRNSATWYKNKTKAVANLMRSYARRNGAMTDDPMTWGMSAGGTGSGIKAGRGEILEGSSWDKVSDKKAAAAAAAIGIAAPKFASQKDFDKWLAQQRRDKDFNKYFLGYRRRVLKGRTMAAAKKRAAKKRPAKKAAKRRVVRRKAVKRATPKRAAAKRKPAKRRVVKRATPKRRVVKRKAPKRAAAKRKPAKKMPRYGTKAYWKEMGRRSAAARRRNARKGGRKAARRPAKARRNYRRSARARANQAFTMVKRLAKPAALVVGGIAAHRFLSSLASGFLTPFVSQTVASVVSNLGILALGGWAAPKFLGLNGATLTLGMAADSVISLLGDFFPAVKAKLGLGVASGSTYGRYVLNGFGQPMMQAAAGFGQPMLQAAAGPMGEYFNPTGSMGEYVSNDLYPAGQFGEYVANSLDVQGYGDYEVTDAYGMSGSGYVDDGVRPDGDLGREFAMMEAKAGVGQPFMQAAAGLPTASAYTPSQQAGMVRGSESSYDAGIFDIGGGNGILS